MVLKTVQKGVFLYALRMSSKPRLIMLHTSYLNRRDALGLKSLSASPNKDEKLSTCNSNFTDFVYKNVILVQAKLEL